MSRNYHTVSQEAYERQMRAALRGMRWHLLWLLAHGFKYNSASDTWEGLLETGECMILGDSKQWGRIQQALEAYGNENGTEAQLEQVMACLENVLELLPTSMRHKAMDAIEEDLKETA